jgi:antitoxin VapB
MSLNIKNSQAHKLAKELASLTGESMSQAVTIAIQQRLEAVRGRTPEEVAARIQDLAADCAGRWREPWASREHGELLYDDLGLPK